MPALLCHSSLICGGSTDLQLHHHSRELQIPSGGRCSDIRSRFSGYGLVEQSRGRRKLRQSRGEEKAKFRGGLRASSWFNLSGTSEVMEMEPIKDCDELDQILEEANKQSQPILIDWMAAWCRKCIYLKPKLEKMAAEYVSKIKFYVVDVNNVPQALVKRGNISKMPTIQIWKDGELKAEVIGGHKAWLVVDEVKEMVQKFI